MARQRIAPPPTRFGAAPVRRTAWPAQPKTAPVPEGARARQTRPAIPPPTRFGRAPAAAPTVQRKAAGTPPPTRFGPAPAQAEPARAPRLSSPPPPTSARPSPPRIVQPAYSSGWGGYGGYGGYGGSGGYGGYGYYVPYIPPTPTTQEIENALQQGNEGLLVINRYGGYAPWNSSGFPGFNIEFYITFKGVMLKAHIKWKWARWYDQDPYAMSVKEMDNSTLENPTQGSHPALWRHLLHEGRRIIANVFAYQLLGQFGGRVQLTDIQQLIGADNREALYALFTSDRAPLSVWDADAWSRFLDWNTAP